MLSWNIFLRPPGVAHQPHLLLSSTLLLQREAEQKAQGNEVPDEYKFDSNCITPGTAFMARLGKHLRFFIRKKISEDTVWQQPVVMFSGKGTLCGQTAIATALVLAWRAPGYR